jgi:DNA mismatch repair protein MutL
LLVRDAATSTATASSGATWKRLRFLTQVRQTYLVCEGAEGLYVLDQHAAAERVVFSKLRRQFESREVASQALLFPLTIEVTARESELLAEHSEQIAAVGLDVRVRTPEAVSLHAVPRLLQRASPERLLRDLLSEVTRSGERAFSDAIDKAIATMACHAAVRAGDPLSADEASALLAALDSADFAGYCPHGRPIVTFTSWEELERKVGRR